MNFETSDILENEKDYTVTFDSMGCIIKFDPELKNVKIFDIHVTLIPNQKSVVVFAAFNKRERAYRRIRHWWNVLLTVLGKHEK